MKTTKIDWCDCTINPVIGCKNGCPYCYAERLNKRFGFIKDWKEPQFFPERLKELNSKSPKTIFMDSMSDVSWWKKEWGYEVYKAMSKNRQHAYIFLTKGGAYPSAYHEIYSSTIFETPLNDKKRNIFFGRSVNNQQMFNKASIFNIDFLSIEPILEPIDVSSLQYSLYIKTIIIGAETGNRKGKVVPKKEWIDNIVKQCDKAKVRIFMKESLREIMGNDFRQDVLPWYEYTNNQRKEDK